MVCYTFGKCFSMDCYCLIHFCGERNIRLRYIFSYNKSYSRPTSFTTTYIFFIHAVGLFYILPYTQSDSRPTSFRTTYILSYTQSDSSMCFHTHSWTRGQGLSGQRKNFLHTVGLFYIFPYTQSDSWPMTFRTTYIFSYTQSVTCIFLHTHDRRLSGQRIFFQTHNRTLV